MKITIEKASMYVKTFRLHGLNLVWLKKSDSSWLASNLGSMPTFTPPRPYLAFRIADLTRSMDGLGPMKVWGAYADVEVSKRLGLTRKPAEVSTPQNLGYLYAWMAKARRPAVIVEFGSAFGVSGMYWLSGLESASCGEMLSFEANPEWAGIARANFSKIGTRFTLCIGTFQDNILAGLRGRKIGIAFIDGIHTSEFVSQQFEIIKSSLEPGGIVIFDDVNFSWDMARFWKGVALLPGIRASVELNGCVGIVEVSQ